MRGTMPTEISVITAITREEESDVMSWSNQAADIAIGDEVFGSDGDKVGDVAAVYPAYIIVEKGFFFPTDYYIPRNAIASFDAGRIYLTITKDAALNSGWDVQPTDL